MTPWVVVLGHRPSYYVDDSKEGGTIDANINQIEPLLMTYKADIVLWGHVHNAFRSCPVFNGTCVPPAADGGYDAPIQVSAPPGWCAQCAWAPAPIPRATAPRLRARSMHGGGGARCTGVVVLDARGLWWRWW